MSGKIKLSLAAVVLAAVMLCACGKNNNSEVSYSADYPYYESQAELTEKADLIIEGTTLESQALPPDETGRVYTVTEVKVKTLRKGGLEEDIIQVKQLGGEYKGEKHLVAGEIYLKPQTEYLLYLSVYKNGICMLNGDQAQYIIKDGKYEPVGDNKIEINMQ